MFKNNKTVFKAVLIIYSFFNIGNLAFANPLDNWQNEKAYKPKPILFLHGFAKGKPSDWDRARNILSRYFTKYQQMDYLETIDFQDPNGSVDTYPNGKAGWADKVNNKINELLDNSKYGFYAHTLNLISHSMGGLAAREYLSSRKYSSNNKIDKLVLIGVPNLGSPWANQANDLAKTQKFGWLMIIPHIFVTAPIRHTLEGNVNFGYAVDINGEAVKDLATDSLFISTLNSREQSQEVSFYGIYGIIGSPYNWYISRDYYGGDGVVSKESQLGNGCIVFKENAREIRARHEDEPSISVAGANPLLQFLDSTKPELAITSPNPAGTTDIYEPAVRIQGKVYKEYLPADSQLSITVEKENGSALPAQTSLLRPSDLWAPDNPDSPVAEFDELINLPGKGKYKISCQVKNPANLASEIQVTWVNVIVPEGTNIIVHCHNPEGKEINSIEKMYKGNYAKIYEGDNFIAYGADSPETHNKPISIYPGKHTIKVNFNGIVLQQTFDLQEGETKVLIFTFPRIEVSNTYLLTAYGHNSISRTEVSSLPGIWELASMSGNISITNHVYLDNFNYPFTISQNVEGTISSTPTSLSVICSGNLNVTENGPYTYAYVETFFVGASGSLINKISIPSTSDFQYWYIQNLPTQVSTADALLMALGGGSIYLLNYETSYYCRIISASYTFYKVFMFCAGAGIVLTLNQYAPVNSHNSDSKNYIMDCRNLRMSSVPYDLIGNAV